MLKCKTRPPGLRTEPAEQRTLNGETRSVALYTRYTVAAMATQDLYGQAVRALDQAAARTHDPARSGAAAGLARGADSGPLRWPRPGCCRTTSDRRPRPWGVRRRRGATRPTGFSRSLADARPSRRARGEPRAALPSSPKRVRPPNACTTGEPSAKCTSNWACAIGRSATLAIVREHLTQAARPCTPSATGATWRWCIRSGRHACPGRPPRRSMAALGQAERSWCSSRPGRAGDRLRHQANVALMQHRPDQALTLAERGIAAGGRHASRLGVAACRADLCPPRQPQPRRRGAQPSSTCGAPCNSCGRRPAPSSIRWRRFISSAASMRRPIGAC